MKCWSCKGSGKDGIDLYYKKENPRNCIYCGGDGEQPLKLWLYWNKEYLLNKYICFPFYDLKAKINERISTIRTRNF